VLEEKEQLMAEISVMVAHAPDGSYLAHPVAYNYHVDGILDTTMLPYFESYKHEKRATEIAIAIAQKLALEGVLTVEYFITTDDRLLVNELAPRIHNSYHASLHGCRTSHAEQAIRSVCGLPLGDPHSVRPSAMANLLGDLWKNGAPPPFERALAHSEVTLHLYNKGEARPGRKMGHLTATGSTPEEAYQRVARAREALKS
jgi:5-(carboxyamino)imidazole ribonucleotide synthase